MIPPQSNVSEPWPVDWCLYKERHLVECFFQKLKWFRRIATRYDKLDASFLAFVYIAAIPIFQTSPSKNLFAFTRGSDCSSCVPWGTGDERPGGRKHGGVNKISAVEKFS